MRGHVKELFRVTAAAKGQGVSIQRRLGLYWISMVLAVFAALILALSLAGVFSNADRQMSDALALQQRNTVSALSEQMNDLTAQCITLSEAVSKEASDTLIANGTTFDKLNDNPTLIAELEESLYVPAYSTLRASNCNGIFLLLDATANTELENAAQSRMGIYLRYSDINTAGSANQRLIYFRGASELARKEQIQMHNRWNLEFDTALIPGYEVMMSSRPNRLADGCMWSERTHLKDTWEDVLNVYVPVIIGGEIRGLCGAELSDLYFRLSYPPVDSSFGGIVTVLAPLDGDQLLLDKAMLGNASGTRLEPKGTLSVKEGTYYNVYSGGGERYLGLHQTLNCVSVEGRALTVVTLIPEGSYLGMAAAGRTEWVVGSLVFLICMLTLALVLSRRFVKPITRSLSALQSKSIPEGAEHRSGISEIDELMAFVRTEARNQKLTAETTLPPSIEELLCSFQEKVDTLTPTERTVLQYYIEGCDVGEVAARVYISLNTAKKHNTNINKKLGVTSREELTLYIDLFRRCGRLNRISHLG